MHNGMRAPAQASESSVARARAWHYAPAGAVEALARHATDNLIVAHAAGAVDQQHERKPAGSGARSRPSSMAFSPLLRTYCARQSGP